MSFELGAQGQIAIEVWGGGSKGFFFATDSNAPFRNKSGTT